MDKVVATDKPKGKASTSNVTPKDKAKAKQPKDKGKADKGKAKTKPTAKRAQSNNPKTKGDSTAPKAKRPKTKAQKKKAREAAAAADVNLRDRKSQAAAIEYLHQWSQDRDNWKFQKVRQTVR